MPQEAPPNHFSYAIWRDSDDLEQGDLLQPEERLRAAIGEVHPYFLDSKYTAFIVLTQTCDLVRRVDRGRVCKAPYVNLAVVRPLQDVLCDLLDRVCEMVRPGIYLAAERQKAIALIQRILNQNEQALGIFYLHPDEAAGISEPSVALLQVSFAFRAKHYDTLVRARCGRLDPVFQARLGWLAGNLYSRVAVRDLETEVRDELATDLLSPESRGSRTPIWLDKQALKKMRTEAGDPLEVLPEAEFKALLARCGAPSPREVAVDRVIAVVKQVLPGASPMQIERVKAKLNSDLSFTTTFK